MMQLPIANAVSFVHEFPPSQIGNVQFLQLGSSPSKTSAKLDLPTPVAPKITRCGESKVSFWCAFVCTIDKSIAIERYLKIRVISFSDGVLYFGMII